MLNETNKENLKVAMMLLSDALISTKEHRNVDTFNRIVTAIALLKNIK